MKISWRFVKKNGEMGVWYHRAIKTRKMPSSYLNKKQSDHCTGELKVDYGHKCYNKIHFEQEQDFRLALNAFLEKDLIEFICGKKTKNIC